MNHNIKLYNPKLFLCHQSNLLLDIKILRPTFKILLRNKTPRPIHSIIKILTQLNSPIHLDFSHIFESYFDGLLNSYFHLHFIPKYIYIYIFNPQLIKAKILSP